MQRERLILVDDHQVVRLGLKAVVERHADLQGVGEASTTADAVVKALRLKPAVVFLDVPPGRQQRHRRLPALEIAQLPGFRSIMARGGHHQHYWNGNCASRPARFMPQPELFPARLTEPRTPLGLDIPWAEELPQRRDQEERDDQRINPGHIPQRFFRE